MRKKTTKMPLKDGSTVSLSGINKVTAKGRIYIYHRPTQHRFKSEWGTWELVDEVKTYIATLSDPEACKPGTWGGLVLAFMKSPEWARLAPRTRKDYETRVFAYLHRMDHVPLEDIDGPSIYKLRDKIAKKSVRRANMLVQVMSRTFSWGMPRGLTNKNPAAGVEQIRRDKHQPRANRPWEMDECATILAEAPLHLKVPLAICMFTGLREADTLSIRWDVYQDGLFNFNPNKNSFDLWLAPPAPLRAVLAEAPRDTLTIAANSRGLPWTESGFRASWGKFRKKLEEKNKVRPKLTVHGLRHTVGNHLADADVSTEDIARILGITIEMAKHYSDRAARKKTASAAVTHLDQIGKRTP